MPRLFLAIRIPPTPPIAALIERLSQMRGVAGVAPENVHVTLRFLGDVDDVQKQALLRLLAQAEMEGPPFEATIQGIGTFPAKGRPRVVWLGVDEAAGARMIRLAHAVDAFADEVGLGPRDKAFRPHLTVARVKRVEGRGTDELAEAIEQEAGRVYATTRVDRVVLVESHLSAAGPTYADLVEVPLG